MILSNRQAAGAIKEPVHAQDTHESLSNVAAVIMGVLGYPSSDSGGRILDRQRCRFSLLRDSHDKNNKQYWRYYESNHESPKREEQPFLNADLIELDMFGHEPADEYRHQQATDQ